MNRLYTVLFLVTVNYCSVVASNFYTELKLAEIFLDRHDKEGYRINNFSQQDSLLNYYYSQEDSLNIFYTHLSLAIIHTRYDTKKMLEHITKASILKPEKPSELAGYLNIIEAEAYSSLSKFEQASSKVKNAVDIFNSSKNRYMYMISQFKYATSIGTNGRINDAYQIFNEVMSELEEEDSEIARLIELNIINHLNVIQLYEDNIKKAKKTVAEVIVKGAQLDEGRIIYNAKGNLSQFLLLEEKYDSAIMYAKYDLAYSIRQNNYSSQYGLNGIIANSYYKLNKLDSAEKYIENAVSLLNKISERGYLQFVTNLIYDFYLETNQPEKLNNFAKRLDKVLDSITLVKVNSNFELNRAQFELENAQNEISQLKTINLLEKEKNEAIRRFNIILVLGIAVSLILVILIFNYLSIIRKKREQLTVQNGQIISKNEELQTQQENLKKQSERILELNHLLEQKMDEAAKELVIKNKKLTEYAFYNSHNIRGPLARILGLISLWEGDHLSQIEKEEMLVEVKKASVELDEIIRELNRMLE